jgi:hypothetical protein
MDSNRSRSLLSEEEIFGGVEISQLPPELQHLQSQFSEGSWTRSGRPGTCLFVFIYIHFFSRYFDYPVCIPANLIFFFFFCRFDNPSCFLHRVFLAFSFVGARSSCFLEIFYGPF